MNSVPSVILTVISWYSGWMSFFMVSFPASHFRRFGAPVTTSRWCGGQAAIMRQSGLEDQDQARGYIAEPAGRRKPEVARQLLLQRGGLVALQLFGGGHGGVLTR